MNEQQRNIVIFGLVGVAALLVYIFWVFGTQYDVRNSTLVWDQGPTKDAGLRVMRPDARFGLRIRMGVTGIVLGVLLPALLAGAAAWFWKADRK